MSVLDRKLFTMGNLDCSCNTCWCQFIPEGCNSTHLAAFECRAQMSDNLAQKKINNFKESANADHLYLVDKVTAYGSSIQGLWRDMSPEQRKSFLQERFPLMTLHDLFERHFCLEKKSCPEHKSIELFDKYRDVMLNPCLNVENLTKDANVLLALLQGRVQYSPEKWIISDKNNSDQFFHRGFFGFDNMHMSWILMNGEDYGEFTQFKPSLAHSFRIMGYPRAITLLEGQASMMGTLRNIVESLLDQIPSLPQRDASLSLDIRHIICADSLAYNARYVTNPEFDIQKLVSVIQSMADLSRDHQYEMQTNPEFFQRYVGISLDNTTGFGRFHTVLEDIDTDTRFDMLWHALNTHVQQLRELHAVVPKSSEQDSLFTARQQFSRKLREIEVFVLELRDVHMRGFDEARKERLPVLKRRWELDTNFEHIKTALGEKESDQAVMMNPLLWCLSKIDILWKDFKVGHYSTTSNALRNLNNVIARSSPSVKQSIDENFDRIISETGILTEILENIALYQFCHDEIETEDVLRAMPGGGWKFLRHSNKVFVDFREWISTNGFNAPGWTFPANFTEEQMKLFMRFIQIPLPEGPKNEAWIKTDKLSRNALSGFWRKKRIDDVIKFRKWGFNEEEIRDAESRLMADANPDHQHNLEVEWESIMNANQAEQSEMTVPKSRKSKKKKKKKTKSRSKNTSPTPEQQSDNQKEPADVEELKAGEVPDGFTAPNYPSESTGIESLWDSLKIKESSKSSAKSEPKVAIQTPTAQTSSGIPVSKKTYGIINTILATRSKERTDLRWDRFCNAMQELGIAYKRTGGSMGQFEPVKDSRWAGKGSIVFHNSHISEGKIPSFIAGIMGKRMVRWLGWDVDMFKIKGKN